MGVVNVTPDSFSDGGRHPTAGTAIAHALELVRQGADILDIGGESTRPGATPVPEDVEIKRVAPVVAGLLERAPAAVLSVDTRKADVAAAALQAGAHIINDVTAGADTAMFETVRQAGAGLVLMHMQGEPGSMQDAPHYDDVVAEVAAYLAARAQAAQEAGVHRAAIAIDPGIGFGKSLDHNLALLAGLPRLVALGYPVLVGASRKALIASLTQRSGDANPPSPPDRVEGSLAAHVMAVARGAHLIRAHDVAAHWRGLHVADAIMKGAA